MSGKFSAHLFVFLIKSILGKNKDGKACSNSFFLYFFYTKSWLPHLMAVIKWKFISDTYQPYLFIILSILFCLNQRYMPTASIDPWSKCKIFTACCMILVIILDITQTIYRCYLFPCKRFRAWSRMRPTTFASDARLHPWERKVLIIVSSSDEWFCHFSSSAQNTHTHTHTCFPPESCSTSDHANLLLFALARTKILYECDHSALNISIFMKCFSYIAYLRSND